MKYATFDLTKFSVEKFDEVLARGLCSGPDFEISNGDNTMTLKEAIALRPGYEQCTNPAHGFGTEIVTGSGKKGICRFVLCPVVQFYPKPTFLYLSEADFIQEAMRQ